MPFRAIAATLSVLACALPLSGATITKANNTNDLNTALSWSGGVPPGAGDVAAGSALVTGTNTTRIGADLSWLGVSVTAPGGPVTITADSTLSLGAAGISLSNATENLALNCNLSLGSSQAWPVAGGRTATIGGSLGGTAFLTLAGPGAILFDGGSGAMAKNGGVFSRHE